MIDMIVFGLISFRRETMGAYNDVKPIMTIVRSIDKLMQENLGKRLSLMQIWLQLIKIEDMGYQILSCSYAHFNIFCLSY